MCDFYFQDFTVVDDYITGLQTLLYLQVNICIECTWTKLQNQHVSPQNIEELSSWDGQSPPTARTFKGKPVPALKDLVATDRNLPNFGKYGKEKKRLIAQEKKDGDLLGDNSLPTLRPSNQPKAKVPSVEEVIGRALDKIVTYNDLDNKYHEYTRKRQNQNVLYRNVFQTTRGGLD